MQVVSWSIQSKAEVLGQFLHPDVCVELNENDLVWASQETRALICLNTCAFDSRSLSF